MKELKAILEAAAKIDFSQRRAALATVVQVRGSSYRSPGARMLITDDGKWTGSISGGCLEGDALRKARMVMTEQKPRTVTYDTREESNQNLGIGLGCNGVIDVLLEPIVPASASGPLQMFRDIASLNQPIAIATAYSGQACGEKLVIKNNEEIMCSFTDGDLNAKVLNDLLLHFRSGTSETKTYIANGISSDLFLEVIQPVISIIIFGGGFDSRPVSQLAKLLGWDVSVTDECVAHIAPVFFPTADHLKLCDREFIARDFDITPFTACILMSHNYDYDRDVLKTIIKSNAPYIGILGPRKRFDKMLVELQEKGINLSDIDLSRIHSPIGLDIGAETPDEIALSIISEIQGKFTNRSGGYLKYRSGPIHQRDVETGQIFRQVFLSSDEKSKSANS